MRRKINQTICSYITREASNSTRKFGKNRITWKTKSSTSDYFLIFMVNIDLKNPQKPQSRRFFLFGFFNVHFSSKISMEMAFGIPSKWTPCSLRNSTKFPLKDILKPTCASVPKKWKKWESTCSVKQIWTKMDSSGVKKHGGIYRK